MKRTPQIEEYCASLTLSREHPTDSLLQTFIGAQSLSRTVEEKLSQNDGLAWDSLSLVIDEECARIKANVAQHGLYINGSYARTPLRGSATH